MNKILVLGKNGQLGQALQETNSSDEWIFLGKEDLDLSKPEAILGKLSKYEFDYLVNCAAYTAVDDAEDNSELAFKINAEALGPISLACCEKDAKLIHISTDYVFGHSYTRPLEEDLATDPKGAYGRTKLKGEETIQSICEKHFIIRTSWLYGTTGKNFMKTMLKLAESKDELNIVYDQVGSPTFVDDLAKTIVHIIDVESTDYGIYHYSNEGVCSWFDFAHAIFQLSGIAMTLNPVLSAAFPTKAERPAYSVLSKQKIKDTFAIDIPHWRDSLSDCLKKLNH